MVFERAAGHVFYYKVGDPLLLAIVVDGENVGVAEGGNGLGLAAEAGQEAFAAGFCGLHDLDGHPALQLVLVGAVDGRHTSLADLFGDLIAADGLSDPIAHFLTPALN